MAIDNRDLLSLLFERKLVLIARGIDADTLLEAAEAVAGAGVCFLEATYNQSAADPIAENGRILSMLVKRFGERLHIGAGTVLNVAQVQAAYDAGARYIIAPSAKPAVIAETKRLGMLAIPGAMTPTEIDAAWDMGADVVKLFPADDLGMHYITNIRGPLPHIPLMATGGVNPQTIPEFLSRGINAVGTGITVFKRDLLQARDFAGIASLAREHVAAVDAWTRVNAGA